MTIHCSLIRGLGAISIALLATISIAVAAPSNGGEKLVPKPLAISLGAPFNDHAILQRDMKVPVWGWSEPGTKVTVSFKGQKVSATADKDGKWVAELAKLKASFEPAEMTITEAGGKTVTLKNILVGEVWMASGQSNMQWICGKSSSSKLAKEFAERCEKEGLKVSPIREFRINSVTSQLHPIERATGAWKDGDYMNHSAIAFAFSVKLYDEIKVPIAILNCSFSQTPIEAWVPRLGWASAKDEHSKAIHARCLETNPSTPEHKKAWEAFYKNLEDQVAASEKAIKAGETPDAISAKLPGNLQGNRDANWLFNGMLNPVVPYAIRGCIWNQGYANMGKGISYYENLHSLVRGWRLVWNRPNLPVYFHQFYSPVKGVPNPGISTTAEMRLGTAMARDIPNTGMASQIDIAGSIHYRSKTVPGRRLALHALKNQYGKNVVADGPFFKSYSVKGDTITVNFEGAKGGLVVADSTFNLSREEGATGYADPKVISNGEDQVKLFWVCGEDRVWHPATCKIQGETVVVRSDAVKKPVGISYGSDGIGFNACLYNKALLPLTPFIQYDQKPVRRATWPDEKLKIAGETIDPSTVGLIYEYRKMPLLATQFRDDAVLQADKPVTIWGSTRQFGEWQTNDEEGECKVHFEFGDIKKVIPVTPGMAEWSVTLPPMKADGKSHTLKVQFTKDGELAHERIAKGILFGDVWYVAAPKGLSGGGKAKEGGPVVRMIQNQSKRWGNSTPSRFSICVSRTPRVIGENGKASNRFAAYWKPAEGLAAQIGQAIAAKSGRPVGIIWVQAKHDEALLSHWMSPNALKDSPSTLKDYKTVGSQYPDNPYYLENVRRYIEDWKSFWGDYIPKMMEAKAVPEGAEWGESWGQYPSPKPVIGDSKATYVYNIYLAPFAPTAIKGAVFLTGESMMGDSNGANFGAEMTALANCFHKELGDADAPLIFTAPSKKLVSGITPTKGINGKHQVIEIEDWKDVSKVISAVAK